MATTITRLTNSGTLYTSNYFDEVTGAVVTNGLVAYLDAGNPSSYRGTGTNITDLSNINVRATMNGNVYWVNSGTASYFNFPVAGDLNYITSNISQSYRDVTIVFQPDFTLSNFGNPVGLIAVNTNTSSADKSLRFSNANGTGPWQRGQPDGNDWNSTATNTATYYLNGNTTTYVSLGYFNLSSGWNILGVTETNLANFPSTFPYYIGASGYPGRGFQGKIAAVLFYNRPLSQAEQVQNYNYFASRYGLTPITKPASKSITTSAVFFNQMDEVTGMINSNGLTALLNASSYAGYGNWNDSSSSPSNFNVTPLGVNIVTTVSNSGFYFPNTSTVAITAYNIPASFFTGTYTISSWVYFIQTNKGSGGYSDNVVLGNGRQTADQGLHLGERGGYPYYGFYGDDLSGNTSLLPNTWYNLVYQYNANTSTLLKSIYVNGVFDSSTVPSGVYSSALNNTEIGRYPWGTTTGYTYGYISQIAFYNRILSPSEILTNYQNQASSYGKSIGVNSPVLRETTSSVKVYGVFDEVTPMIVTNGISLNLDALQYPGSGNWADLSPTGDSIVLNTTTFVTSTTNYFTFNGVNSYAYTQYLNPSPYGPQNFSLGVWFRTAATQGRMIGYTLTEGNGVFAIDRPFYIGIDGKVYFAVYTGTTNQAVSSTVVLNNNAWHYAVATITTSTLTSNMNLYIDGALVSTGSSFGYPQSFSGYWEIGGGQSYAGGFQQSGSNQYFPGNIGMVHVYNRPISAAEVAENFNQTRGRYGV